jgi:hypothetical protein
MPSKASAITHGNMLETADVTCLKHLQSSYCFYTTDMGAELGLSAFQKPVTSMLPEWHPTNSGRAFVFEEDEGQDSNVAGVDLQDDGYFLPRHRTEALLRCKYWCLMALTVDRQWQHIWNVG